MRPMEEKGGAMSGKYQVTGGNAAAPFTLKLHRGDGMLLLAMNWKKGPPPRDFVGFAIEYREPEGKKFFPLKNRLAFPGLDGKVNPNILSTRISPIQKFRWVHFPRNAELRGKFLYKVTPVFMNTTGDLSYGEEQGAAIELNRETFPKKLNVTYTRGFVSSQAFVDRYQSKGPISTLLPGNADQGLTFVPTHSEAKDALKWMGFEARSAILEVLDAAIADKKARVCVIAYDLSEREVVSRLEKLGGRLRVIIDDSKDHGEPDSAEGQAQARLAASAGAANVRRQHMRKLQHNKTIVVDGPRIQAVVCGSTNFSWRGFYVQSNNALVLKGKNAVKAFLAAFEAYWNNDGAAGFGATPSAIMTPLAIAGIKISVGFSPYAQKNAMLQKIADDIGKTSSSLFYSLAFLFQTPGAVLEAIKKVTGDEKKFVYGMSDKEVGGLDLQMPNGNVAPVSPVALGENVPEPFKSEPAGGGGIRMHHKFVVIDFDKSTARVYLGSYNFSSAADVDNGENLLLIRDRRVAVSYMIEALRIFDHYHFRVAVAKVGTGKPLTLKKAPAAGELPWWDEHFKDVRKIRDRTLFA